MKNLKIFVILIIAFLGVESCTSDDLMEYKMVALNEEFIINFNEEISLELEQFQMKIIHILEDSRCQSAENINCLENGKVRADLELVFDNQVVNREIIFRKGKNIPLKYGDYNIQIHGISPNNQIDEMINLEDYNFKMTIEKLSNKKPLS